MNNNEINRVIRNYHRDIFARFGKSPEGVDWKNKEYQTLSFKYIMDTIRLYFNSIKSFSIFEVGCGYGAFYEFLKERDLHKNIDYSGIDLVDEMISEAIANFPELKNNLYVGDFKSYSIDKTFDFVTSSGIFNVKAPFDDAVFEKNILQTINSMFKLSTKGTVFNLMTPSPDYKDPKLFYPSLDTIYSFICNNLSRKISIISSYPLWKITVGVFK